MYRINIVTMLVLIVIPGLQSTKSIHFSYAGEDGPDHWGKQYDTCGGKHQSPINIDIVKVKNLTFPPLHLNGFDTPPMSAKVTNDGHTAMVTMEFVEQPTITGGPVNDSYKFVQLHFHWGDDDMHGSEDLINNQSFPAELHMVFYNTKYTEFEKALNFSDGLVVLASFFKISNHSNLAYVGLSHLLEKITKPKAYVRYSNPPTLRDMIPTNLQNYFTYSGSLTTPPCLEVVTWIDFETPIHVSSEQIKKFRNLKLDGNEFLKHNYRPIQPLNERVVYRNVKSDETTSLSGRISNLNDKIVSNDSTNLLYPVGNNKSRKSEPMDDIEKVATKTKKGRRSSSLKIALNNLCFIFSILLNYIRYLSFI